MKRHRRRLQSIDNVASRQRRRAAAEAGSGHSVGSHQVRPRLLAMALLVLVCFVILIWRWSVLQVQRHELYATRAENNRTAIVPIPPARGDILDRNGLVLATNYTAYTLEITPGRVAGSIDDTIDALATIIPITEADRKRFHRLRQESRRSYEPVVLRNRLTEEEIARFSVQRFRFPGVQVNARLFRTYPNGETAAHLIGYIGRINQKEKEDIEDSERAANYRGTTHIGKLGIELAYEDVLHGTSGSERLEVTAGGHMVRRLESQPAIPGQNVVLSLDMRLQKMVEDLFGRRRGALVAIDPRDGQILAMVSKPTFDPNLFVDGIDQENWRALNESIDKPLLNRALRGTYPPGSTYKPFMGLAALETGKRTAAQAYWDPGFWEFGGHRFRSPEAGGLGHVNLSRAITLSSNVYFYILAHEMGVDTIHDFMAPLGFGQYTGIDLPGEARGILPSTSWKRNAYKRAAMKKWYPGETISLGIGQGYNNFTILQVAHALSTMLSNGNNRQPRLAQSLQNPITRQTQPVPREPAKQLGYRPTNVDLIKNAMVGVAQSGTARAAFAGAGYISGGKTGTAQAVTIRQNQRYNAAALAEHKRDHSLYIAFAPVDNPTIALAVIVENAGWGSAAAAPIARRVLDYWLLGLYPSPQDIAMLQQGGRSAPIGQRRHVADMPWPPDATSTVSSSPAMVSQHQNNTHTTIPQNPQVKTYPSSYTLPGPLANLSSLFLPPASTASATRADTVTPAAVQAAANTPQSAVSHSMSSAPATATLPASVPSTPASGRIAPRKPRRQTHATTVPKAPAPRQPNSPTLATTPTPAATPTPVASH